MSRRNFPALRQPDRSTTREDMAAILERNSNGKAALPPEPQLAWNEPVWTNEAKTHGYIISTCDRFMIDKADSSYNAYLRGTRQHAGQYLGHAGTSDGAKALCEARARP